MSYKYAIIYNMTEARPTIQEPPFLYNHQHAELIRDSNGLWIPAVTIRSMRGFAERTSRGMNTASTAFRGIMKAVEVKQ